jgi:WD40 repeat protein
MVTLALLAVLGGFGPEPLVPGTPYVLTGHGDTLTAVAFSPDSKLLASAARDKTVKLWSLTTGDAVSTLTLGLNQLTALAFSFDGARLAVGDAALQVQIIEVSSGKVLQTIAHPDAVAEVDFSPDGKLLAVAGVTDNGAVYELATSKKKFEFRGRTARFSADGQVLLTARSAGEFALLDVKTGKARKTVSTAPEAPLATLSRDGKHVATWTPMGVDVKLWGADGKSQGVLKGPAAEMDRRKARVTGVALTADGSKVVVAGADGLVRVWTPASMATVQVWPADKNTGLTLSADGVWVAVMDQGLVKLWKLP